MFNFFIEFYCACALEQQLEIEQVDNHRSGARAMRSALISFLRISTGMCSVRSFKSLAAISPVVTWSSQCSLASAFRGFLGLPLKLLLGVLLAVRLESREPICFSLSGSCSEGKTRKVEEEEVRWIAVSLQSFF